MSQAELTVDSDIHSSDFPEPPDALEADTFPDEIHQPKITVEPSFNDAHVSKFSNQNSTELMDSVMVRTEEISDTDLKQEESSSPLARAYVTEVSCSQGNRLWVLALSLKPAVFKEPKNDLGEVKVIHPPIPSFFL